MSQNDRTKRNTQDTQHTTATWTRRHARQRQLQQLERQRRRTAARLELRRGSTVAVGRNDHVSVPRLTTKHGRRRHFGRYGHATWISASLSRPSHAITSNSSCSGRWRRCVESPHDDHRTTSHSIRPEALTDVLLELRSSRLLVVSSRLLCSISNVELHCSLENDFPARNSRADAN